MGDALASTLDNKVQHCAPQRVDNFKRKGSCLTLAEAKQLAKVAGIEINRKKDKSTSKIVDKVLKTLKDDTCRGEHCLLKKKEYARLLRNVFRPIKPSSWYSNERQWLSTDDIIKVMKQYEASHPDFAFVDVCPINFAERLDANQCVSPAICNVEPFMKSILKDKKSHYGIIFNLDRHDQGGSHWVAMYCSLDPMARIYGIYYYDSVGVMPRAEFQTFMNNVQTFVRNNVTSRRHFTKQVNKHRRQFKDTECGVYSMVSIISCLENRYDKHFRKVCIDIEEDDNTHKLRNVLYTPLLVM